MGRFGAPNWHTSTSDQVSNCDGSLVKIYHTSQIPGDTGEFELRTSCIQSRYLTHILVRNLTISWRISTQTSYCCCKLANMGTSNQPPIVSPGARGFELDNREGQINFTFKVILRPYISRIRMFAIEILLLGVLFGTILGPTSTFQWASPLLFR